MSPRGSRLKVPKKTPPIPSPLQRKRMQAEKADCPSCHGTQHFSRPILSGWADKDPEHSSQGRCGDSCGSGALARRFLTKSGEGAECLSLGLALPKGGLRPECKPEYFVISEGGAGNAGGVGSEEGGEGAEKGCALMSSFKVGDST